MKISIEICLCITQFWLNKLGHEYKYIYKDIFINGYKWLDIVENYTNFLKIMKDLKSYMIEFKENGTIKHKVYFNDYVVKDPNQYLVIVIIHNECIFSVNDGVW